MYYVIVFEKIYTKVCDVAFSFQRQREKVVCYYYFVISTEDDITQLVRNFKWGASSEESFCFFGIHICLMYYVIITIYTLCSYYAFDKKSHFTLLIVNEPHVCIHFWSGDSDNTLYNKMLHCERNFSEVFCT